MEISAFGLDYFIGMISKGQYSIKVNIVGSIVTLESEYKGRLPDLRTVHLDFVGRLER